MPDESFLEELTERSTCQLISSGKELAGTIAVASVFTGQVWGAVGGTAGVIAMEALGMNLGCTAGQDPDDPDWQPYPEDCWKNSDGGCLYTLSLSGQPIHIWQPGCIVTEILRQEFKGTEGFSGNDSWWTYYRTKTGTETFSSSTVKPGDPPPRYWITGGCDEGGLHQNPPPYGTPIGKPYVWTDPETGCTWTVSILDTYIASNGLPQFHYKAVSDDPVACGGPYEWWGNGDGPNVPVGPDPRPNPPTPPPPPIPPRPHDEDDNCPEIPPPATLSGTTYQLTGVCEDVAQGQPQPVSQFTSAGGEYYNELANRIDNLAAMLQKHLELKTPVCAPSRPELKGDYRTLTFVSDEQSPDGRNCLRKRFRYRSESSNDLGRLVDHWADFTWQAGPVCVQHSGSSVGTPQVWAASADEGKRVIRHAFGEAGVDPDQTGKWTVSGSNNPRYGVSGTMRICTKGGYYWITERLGSNARPEVQLT